MKEDFGTLLESGAIRFERDLPGPIERIWDYIVDPEKRALWFGGGTRGDDVGDSYVIAFDHERLSSEPFPERFAKWQKGVTMEAQVAVIDPPRLFVFTYDGDGETRIELKEQGARVRLILTQMPGRDFKELLSVAAGWHAHLAILVDILEGSPPRGFWSEHEMAERHYERAFR